MPNSIPISGLNQITANDITLDDFLPLVDSASMTTYRTEVREFNTWMAASGSVMSASWATESFSASHAGYADNADTSSFSFWALSSSYAQSSSIADTASYAWFSHSGSYAQSASWAGTASYAHRAFTSSYAIRASNADSASHAERSISSSFASSSLSCVTSSFALATGRTVPVGTICAYAGTSAPAGWLKCDGSIIPVTADNAALIALIGYSYSPIPSCTITITHQTANAYQDLNNGTVTFTFSGGSGVYAVYWAATMTTWNLTSTSPTKVFTGLDGYPDPQNYNYTLYDTGVTPVISQAGTAQVGYNRVGSSTVVTIGTSQYRTPNLTNYFDHTGIVSPLIWIIKQ